MARRTREVVGGRERIWIRRWLWLVDFWIGSDPKEERSSGGEDLMDGWDRARVRLYI